MAMPVPPTDRQWLLFDVGGVLSVVDDDTWPQQLQSRWAEQLGLSREEFRRRWAAIPKPSADVRSGTEAAYWVAIADGFGVDANTRERWREEFWEAYCGEPDLELFDLARRVHGSVGLAVLSNSMDGAREQEQRRFGLGELFDPICYSHEIGVNKPDPQAFWIALRRMGARPEQVLFIDDRHVNISAAQDLGIRGVIHRGSSATISVVEQYLDHGRGGTPPVEAH